MAGAGGGAQGVSGKWQMTVKDLFTISPV